MTSVVLDASALLAFLHQEPGGEKVVPMLSRCIMSAVNLAETYSQLGRYGAALPAAANQVQRLQIPIMAFDNQQAMLTASIHNITRGQGLSLGDCACLALGMSQKAMVVTADRKWAMLRLDVEIVQIR
ncbi:MAG: type II toxin-antitoxin system VapC family toxin [Bacteroidales bacterium]|nr:type II toxin-antitoxin system VapC family toxin [Bacteroidales bacterium]